MDKFEIQRTVAGEFARAGMAAISIDGKVQAESLIIGVARMAGTFYFRSFNFEGLNLQPGQPVLSGVANERGPELMRIAGNTIDVIGLKIDQAKVQSAMTNPDPAHAPALDFKATQERLDRAFLPIKMKYALSLEEAGRAAAMATAALIADCQKVLDVNIAFAIAVRGFVEGTKTAPYPLDI